MSATQQASASIEYSVYVYHAPTKKQKSSWEMKGVTNDMDKALLSAQSFFDSKEFQKVEVKKKYFDEKNDRTIDMTLKTFQNTNKEMGAFTMLAISLILSGAAFAAAYFLTLPPAS